MLSSEEFDAIIDKNDQNEEADVADEVHVEELVRGAILLAGQDGILDYGDQQEERHLVLDTLVDEGDDVGVRLERNVKGPC